MSNSNQLPPTDPETRPSSDVPDMHEDDNGQDQDKRKSKDIAIQEEIEKQKKKYTQGQMLRFVRVRFPGNARSFPFLIGKRQVSHADKVVAMSDRGMAVGHVNSFPYEVPYSDELLPIRSINKVASDDDIQKQSESYRKEKEVETLCVDLIERHQLDMNLTHVEFTQFGKKAVFYFTAPARVDFRNLVKDLVGQLKTRIELRQISLRDRAAAIGGIGPCGRQVCCSSFLTKYGVATIRMAKNQTLTMNFNKLNGVCGQLKCCLQYEDGVYADKRKQLPEEGKIIATANGDWGQVERLHLLEEHFDMLTEHGVLRRYTGDQYLRDKMPPDRPFPKQFDHIINETSAVIGKRDREVRLQRELENDIQTIRALGKPFAEEEFAKQIELPPSTTTDDPSSNKT